MKSDKQKIIKPIRPLRYVTQPVVNALIFQGLWLATAFGVAMGNPWWGPMTFTVWASAHFIASPNLASDLRVVALYAAMGWFADGALMQAGLIQHHGASGPLAPYWIVTLWAGVALQLNYCFRFAQDRLVLASLLGGIGVPIAYLAGERFGALNLISIWGTVGVGFIWFMALPLGLLLAKRWSRT